ncbi:MAG: hypothetical protein E7E95_06145, partial [Prevotella bivia]|nr:hypothetical protein [Prevotella bivia]
NVTTQQPQVALLVLSYNSKIALIEPNCDGSFFHAIVAMKPLLYAKQGGLLILFNHSVGISSNL